MPNRWTSTPSAGGRPSASLPVSPVVTNGLRVGVHAGGVLSPLGGRIEVNAGTYLRTCREPLVTRTFRACEMRRVDAALAAIAADPGAVARCCPGHALWAKECGHRDDQNPDQLDRQINQRPRQPRQQDSLGGGKCPQQ